MLDFFKLLGFIILFIGIFVEFVYFYYDGLYGGLVTGWVLLLLSLNVFILSRILDLEKELKKC